MSRASASTRSCSVPDSAGASIATATRRRSTSSSGTLTLVIEREAKELRQGELARVAPEVRRFIANRGEEDVVLIALGGSNEHVGRDGEAFEDWEQEEGRSPQEVPLPADER